MSNDKLVNESSVSKKENGVEGEGEKNVVKEPWYDYNKKNVDFFEREKEIQQEKDALIKEDWENANPTKRGLIKIDENDKPKINLLEIVDFLLEINPTLYYDDELKQFFYYSNKEGHYVFDYEGMILRQQLEYFLGIIQTTRTFSEVKYHIANKRIKKTRNLPIPPLHLINVKNGILNIDTEELLPFNKNFYFFNKIPVNYKNGSECPLIEKFLSEVLNEENKQTIIEFIGYCMYRGYTEQKAIMLTGSGHNGKSSIIDLIRTFLGVENCSAEELKQIIENNFSIAELHNKLLNCFADISGELLTSTSRWKALTSGKDLMSAQRKFQQPFRFVNYAKFIFSANQLPPSPDNTFAFFKRWHIMMCTKQFSIENDDKNLLNKISTPSELSGLLNLAVKGLKKLLDGGFTHPQSEEFVKDLYIHLSDNIKSFIIDCIDQVEDDYVIKEELYNNYKIYCKFYNTTPSSENLFFKEIKNQCSVWDFRPEILGTRKMAFKGIILNEKFEKNIKTNKMSGMSTFFLPYGFVKDVKDVKDIKDEKGGVEKKSDMVDTNKVVGIKQENEKIRDFDLMIKFIKQQDFEGNDVALYDLFDNQMIQQALIKGEIYNPKPNWFKII